VEAVVKRLILTVLFIMAILTGMSLPPAWFHSRADVEYYTQR